MITGEEIPEIHSATRAQVRPKSGAPSDGTGDAFTTAPVGPAGRWGRTRTSPSREMLAARRVLPDLSPAGKAHVTESHTLLGN